MLGGQLLPPPVTLKAPHGLLADGWDTICINPSHLLESSHIQDTSVQTVSYHTVHGEVVVLCLELHRMRMAGPNLSVAVQKQALVVCDPVKHLPEWKETTWNHPRKTDDWHRPRSRAKPIKGSVFALTTSQAFGSKRSLTSELAVPNLHNLQESVISWVLFDWWGIKKKIGNEGYSNPSG